MMLAKTPSRILLCTSILLMLGAYSPVMSQSESPRFRIYVSMTDTAGPEKFSSMARIAFHPDADFGVDADTMRGFTDRWFETDGPNAREENSWPPCAPSGALESQNFRAPTLPTSSNGQPFNCHPYVSRTQIDTFRITWACRPEAITCFDPGCPRPLVFRWPKVLSEYVDSMKWITNTIPVDRRVTIDMTQQSSWTLDPTVHLDATGQIITQVRVIVYGPKVPPGYPDTIEAINPPPGSMTEPTNPILTWTTAPRPRYYRVQVATDRRFTNIVLRDSVETNTKQLSGLTMGQWYYWRVMAFSDYGVSYYKSPADSFRVGDINSLDDGLAGNPREFALHPNYPNPFNPTTSVTFDLPTSSVVTISVHNTLGQQVAKLHDVETMSAGRKTVEFDSRDLPSGIYYFRMIASPLGMDDLRKHGSYAEVIKMMLTR